MNFELKFSSSKGEFPINVDFVAILEKRRIPLAYYVAQEAIITTTDQAAIEQLSKVLLECPLSFVGETVLALLVQANDSRWIIYGRKVPKEDNSSNERTGEQGTLRVVARMLSNLALTGFARSELQDGESAFLVKKVRSALDDHQVKKRKKRRLSPEVPTTNDASSTALQGTAATQTTTPDLEGDVKVTVITNSAKSAEKESVSDKRKQSSDKTTLSIDTMSIGLTNKSMKDKLKKMIVTLLSLQGISKKSPTFKDLYQHSLQAASFALRHVPTDDVGHWEAQAMNINQSLLKIFLGSEHKEV